MKSPHILLTNAPPGHFLFQWGKKKRVRPGGSTAGGALAPLSGQFIGSTTGGALAPLSGQFTGSTLRAQPLRAALSPRPCAPLPAHGHAPAFPPLAPRPLPCPPPFRR